MRTQHLPDINTSLCTACGICVSACPTGALSMDAGGPRFSAPENCNYCTDCESLCPVSAITCDFLICWSTDPAANP
jgi:ferredoxin